MKTEWRHRQPISLTYSVLGLPLLGYGMAMGSQRPCETR
jgi:hypothetical protein